MKHNEILKLSLAYTNLSNALQTLEAEKPEKNAIHAAVMRGYFTPQEDDLLWSLVSRYLTIRNGFWEIIDAMADEFHEDSDTIKTPDDWRHFLIGYAASCQVVRMGRLLVDDVASHSLVQRKVNEGSPQHRIARKVYTQIFDSLSSGDNAMKMQYMMAFVDTNRHYIKTLSHDQIVGVIVADLDALNSVLDSSFRAYLRLRLRFVWHSIRRRLMSSKQKSSSTFLQHSGAIVSDIGLHENKRVTEGVQQQLLDILQPGDVLATRNDRVAINLFLPGYWPHTALYIGSEDERRALGMDVDESIGQRWSGEIRVLEAKKDGVFFRPLAETLFVDECVILRPQLTTAEIVTGLERICLHEGKGYNFDFDFFRSDRLVCTEVIYRAFDDLGGMHFDLLERAGRFCLTAEDIIQMGLDGNGFHVQAVFGFDGCEDRILTGESALQCLRKHADNRRSAELN